MAYGPGVNEINYSDLPPTGDTVNSAFQKTQNQFDALYTGLNADIVRASAAEVNTAEDTTKIVTPGTLLKGKASGVASLNESGKVTGTELPNASTTVKGAVELATPDEVKQGTDNERAVTPAGFKAAFGEFYPVGVTPTYVDSTHFTVSGDLTAIFTKGRVLKITDTGGTFNAVCVSSAYDSGTKLTTVTVAGDTIDSGISAVLYAVQQHTGAIWESGSNANGKYVKFADGTFLCRHTVELTGLSKAAGVFVYSTSSWTLPVTATGGDFVKTIVNATLKDSNTDILYAGFALDNTVMVYNTGGLPKSHTPGQAISGIGTSVCDSAEIKLFGYGRWF